jgi:hypothetical protein
VTGRDARASMVLHDLSTSKEVMNFANSLPLPHSDFESGCFVAIMQHFVAK